MEITYTGRDLDVEYDAVVVIDGLPPIDRTKHQVTEQLLTYLRSEGIQTHRADCGNAAGFQKLIGVLRGKAAAGGRFLLHFICHGNESGISLGTDFVPFGDLTSCLEELNTATGQTLILNMSCCRGLNGIKIVDPEARDLPFFGLIGSSRDLSFGEIPEINQRMYFFWQSGERVNDLVEKVNRERGEEVLYCISAEGYQQIRHGLSEVDA